MDTKKGHKRFIFCFCFMDFCRRYFIALEKMQDLIVSFIYFFFWGTLL